MTREMKLHLCKGCRDDFYNTPGNSFNGECFMLANAEPMERTKVGWWQPPPYKWSPQITLNCHRSPGNFAWINRDDVRIRTEEAEL